MLLAARNQGGHWSGILSSSALATATAVTALALARQHGAAEASDRDRVRRGLAWLIATQNADGGWGDTTRSLSNISTTALGWAALAFGDEGEPRRRAEMQAGGWLERAAGASDPDTLAAAIAARYGKDRTFSVPILTMCALAGRFGTGGAAWQLVPQLPFELAVFPRRLFTTISLPVVSYALPALIAMGVVRHRLGPPAAAPARAVRDAATSRALRVLEAIQPPNGGFLEATPLTSFVGMSLIGAGCGDHPVVRRALAFLRASMREDGSWPIDTNLATWVSTLSVQALSAGGRLGSRMDDGAQLRTRNWLLHQQSSRVHPYTGAAAGAWAWTDLPGGVPDADDTAGALLALHALDPDDAGTRQAAAHGVRWLLDLQNRDGGIPTFCRGWGALPFDRSGADLTAHALRAWIAWRPALDSALARRTDRAAAHALQYLLGVQGADGSFVPLWFGNERAPEEANPTYGTSRVVLALGAAHAAGYEVAPALVRATSWLLGAQHPDGGWGGAAGVPASIEETALAVGALAALPDAVDGNGAARQAAVAGAAWLSRATAGGRRFEASAIGFYFAKLWYFEELYPLIFTVEAFERLLASQPQP